MATKIASLFAEIGADVSGLHKGLGKARTEMSDAARNMSHSGSQLAAGLKAGIGSLTKTAGMAGASILAVGAAMDQAFELGAQGAAITQTRESFDGLMRSVGAAPDILQQLRAASRDTISDMDLMASTTTLLAGASGQLATELASATPELMAIAKAANKLNPTLGDTQFMYQSLATGIKRSSPLILDNLGLTIKVGEANERMAESLGKSVEELTAQEKQMALLNETLRAGSVLIEQAGGAGDSAVDSFKRLETATANLGNALKEKLAPGLATAAETAVTLLTWNDKIDAALRDNMQNTLEGAETYADYSRRLEEAAKAAGLFINEEGDLIRISGIHGQMTQKVVEANYRLSESAWESERAILAIGDGYGDVAENAATFLNTMEQTTEAAWLSTEAFIEAAAGVRNLAEAFGEMSFDETALYELAIATGASEERLAQLGIQLGLFTQTEVDAARSGYALVDMWYAELVSSQELETRFGLLNQAIAQNEISMALSQRAAEGAAGGMAYLDGVAAGVIGTMGDMGDAIEEIPEEKTTAIQTVGYDEAIAQAVGLGAAIRAIPTIHRTQVQVTTTRYERMGIPGRQHGGIVDQPLTWVGEAGPELVALPAGSEVIPHEQSRDIAGSATWHGDLIIQGAGNPEATAAAVIRRLSDRGLIPRTALR